MSRARRERAAIIAVLVATAALPWSGSVRAAPSHVSLWPRCLEPRIAAGDVYPIDRGLALAVTRGIASQQPTVASFVAAVSDYEATHPRASEDTFDGYGPVAVGPLYFTLTVIMLAERPELARPELMADLVEIGAGRDHSVDHGGIAGVYEFLWNTGAPFPDHSGPNVELFMALAQQAEYVYRHGIVRSGDWRRGEGSARGVFGCDDVRDSR
jgi:hypothetical protein